MIYIDTDVLVHAYVIQDLAKNRQANQRIRQANANDTAVISTLTVQELLFVLARLGIEDEVIHTIYNEVMQLEPLAYDITVLQRAYDMARHVGFRNINDCIHTAIAEQHCSALITYNRRDFSRIREFAEINVTILGN